MQVQIFHSPNELRAAGPRWDDLWRRSRVSVPTVKAEPLALWLECFVHGTAVAIVTVEHEGRLLAALPLVEERIAGLRAGCLPNNQWSASGDLLLDPAANAETTLPMLLDAVQQQGASLLWLNGTVPDRADWRQWVELVDSRQQTHFQHEIWPVGVVDIVHNWDTYWKSRSRNHRRQIQRTGDRLRGAGGAELRTVSHAGAGEIEEQLRLGFELERKSWKATEGTCVLDRPEVFEFYCRQATALAATGNLELVFLEHHGKPIAFEYGWRAKGVYFSPKVAYDAEFAAMSPGQQLRAMQYEEFQLNPNYQAVDFHGPLAEATAKWATRKYSLGRLAIGIDHRGSALVRAYAWARPWYKAAKARFRRATSEIEIRPVGDPPPRQASPDHQVEEPLEVVS